MRGWDLMHAATPGAGWSEEGYDLVGEFFAAHGWLRPVTMLSNDGARRLVAMGDVVVNCPADRLDDGFVTLLCELTPDAPDALRAHACVGLASGEVWVVP